MRRHHGTFWAMAIAALVGALALAAWRPAAAQSYTIRNLGTQLGHTKSYARGLNDKGEVVGYTISSDGTEIRAFCIGPPYISMETIRPYLDHEISFALDINNHGVVAGYSQDATAKSIMTVWSAGTLSMISHILGADSSALRGINNRGDMAGVSGERGFLFREGAPVMCAHLPGYAYTMAIDVNDSRMVAGFCVNAALTQHRATKWHLGLADAVPDLGGTSSRALAIANDGLIVGMSRIPGDTETHAFMTTPEGVVTDLGTLGGNFSEALGTNGSVVVGGSNTGVEDRAFVYTGGMMLDLSDLIPAGTDWILREATDVNEYGQICGWGTYDGQTRAFLLTPYPPLYGVADWNFRESDHGWTAATSIPPFADAEAEWFAGTGYGLRATGFPCFGFLQSPELLLRHGRTYRIYVDIVSMATADDTPPQMRLRVLQTTTNMSEFLALDSVADAIPSRRPRTYEFTITPQIATAPQIYRICLDLTHFNPDDQQNAWYYLQRVIVVED